LSLWTGMKQIRRSIMCPTCPFQTKESTELYLSGRVGELMKELPDQCDPQYWLP
jgi:hypothetical protein